MGLINDNLPKNNYIIETDLIKICINLTPHAYNINFLVESIHKTQITCAPELTTFIKKCHMDEVLCRRVKTKWAIKRSQRNKINLENQMLYLNGNSGSFLTKNIYLNKFMLDRLHQLSTCVETWSDLIKQLNNYE